MWGGGGGGWGVGGIVYEMDWPDIILSVYWAVKQHTSKTIPDKDSHSEKKKIFISILLFLKSGF